MAGRQADPSMDIFCAGLMIEKLLRQRREDEERDGRDRDGGLQVCAVHFGVAFLYAGKGANGRRASRRTSTRRSIANKKQTGGGATSTAPAAEDDEEARLRSYFEAQQQAPGGIVAQ